MKVFVAICDENVFAGFTKSSVIAKMMDAVAPVGSSCEEVEVKENLTFYDIITRIGRRTEGFYIAECEVLQETISEQLSRTQME